MDDALAVLAAGADTLDLAQLRDTLHEVEEGLDRGDLLRRARGWYRVYQFSPAARGTPAHRSV